jgi:uncharacterized membrane protein YcfT
MNQQRRWRMRVASVLWPAFLMAGVLEMLVFSLVDPGALQWMGGRNLDWSPRTVYSLGFLAFWLVIAVAGAMTQALAPRADDQFDNLPPQRPTD